DGCESFPAVNAAGETSGGLQGTKGRDGCGKAPLGSQVYGRSGWYQDKWAIMYAWYFPKNFHGNVLDYEAKKRHDWASMVLWIDNPAIETSKILGASLSQQNTEEPYQKMAELHPMFFVGAKQHVNGTEPPRYYQVAYGDSQSQDLIMWEQLTDAAREGLNSADFGDCEGSFQREKLPRIAETSV
ncbi:hypothetical protein PHYSODRAFT_264058, partial [Phytophthora sojae]